MANEVSHDSVLQGWDATKVQTRLEDMRRNPAFGFVRLARLTEMGLALAQAYAIRLHPDTHLLLGELTENLHYLQPADLGRFVALEHFNSVQHIYAKAFSDGPGLTLTLPDTPPYRKGPDCQWCDEKGNQHRVLRAPSREYGRAMRYRDDLEVAVEGIFQDEIVHNPTGIPEYQQGWLSAGHELVTSHLEHQDRLRDQGPALNLAPTVWGSDARIVELLGRLGKPPEPQSGGMTA